MDPSVRRLDYSLLDSLDWSDNTLTLSSFLDQFGSSLPHVVKVHGGFHGDAFDRTIDTGQILILHSLYKETKILAKDAQKTNLFIPKNFQVKVEMIPKNSVQESTSVKELLQTFPIYFRALSAIPSHDITSGSMFKIIRQKGYDCFECLQIIDNREEREVRLPLSLKGRFQALQDSREFFLDEVYAEEKDNLDADVPVNVHFVESSMSGISLRGLNVESLYELGTVRLVGECETETVFASVLSSEDYKTLAVFPRDLEITVQPVKTDEHYDSIRRAIKETQLKTVKRIERLNKLSLYQDRNPVRQFPQTELEPPALPGKTRSKSVMETSNESTVEKQRSNSTPPLPPKMLVTSETSNKQSRKKLPKQASSVPTPKPAGFDDHTPMEKELGKTKRKLYTSLDPTKKRPTYRPPDVPHEAQPPLPPKEKSKSSVEDKEQTLASGEDLQTTRATDQQEQENDPDSPPIPPPRSRRRQKSLGKRSDLRKTVDTSSGYEPMDWVECGQEYVPMDGSWMEKNATEDDEDETLEKVFGDGIENCEAGDTNMAKEECNLNETEGKLNSSEMNQKTPRKYKETVILPNNVPVGRERADNVDYENAKEIKIVDSTKKLPGTTVLQNDASENRERADSVDYENTKEIKLTHSTKQTPEKTVLQNDASENRKRADSVDYENTKELKLEHTTRDLSGKAAVLQNDVNEQRERADSIDYENTKELRLDPSAKVISEKSALQDDINEQRERADSVDYENTKELKLDPSAKVISEKSALQDDINEQRERADSVDYENTKELKLDPSAKVISEKSALQDDINEQRERADSVDYENMPKLSPPGKKVAGEEGVCDLNINEGIPRTHSIDHENTKKLNVVTLTKEIPGENALPVDTSEEMSRKDSLDYENAAQLELKIPPIRKQISSDKQKLDRKDHVTQDHSESESSSDLGSSSKYGAGKITSHVLSDLVTSSSPCSGPNGSKLAIEKTYKVDDKSIPSTQTSSPRMENTSDSMCQKEGKTIMAKTEEFLKEINLGVKPDHDSTSKLEATKNESCIAQSQDTSDGIYYTSMAGSVADDPSYYTTMAPNNLKDVHPVIPGNDDNTIYMPMDGPNNDSIYDDISDPKEYDSDGSNYESVDPLRCSPRKANQRRNNRIELGHTSDAYEEVDIIQKIESVGSGTPGENEPVPTSRDRCQSDSYEEIEYPSTFSSNLPRQGTFSDNSYEAIDLPSNTETSCRTKTLSDSSAPPTPPQRRARKRKNIAAEVKGGDQEKSEALSPSPKSGEARGTAQDFEDLDELHVHIAMKESQRQMLFEQALSHQNQKVPQKTGLTEKSLESSLQEDNAKEVPVRVVDKVSDKYKSRPPAPPPRKPVKYLDVETKANPNYKPFKKRNPCNYSEVVGEVKTKHSSKDDDMEYIGDIELHYFQKEHMEMEKRRKAKNDQKKENTGNSASSHGIKNSENEKGNSKLGSNKVCGSHHTYTEILALESQQSHSDMKTEIPKEQAPNEIKAALTKDGSLDSKMPVVAKKPIIKRKPSHDPVEPITSKHDPKKPVASQHSSHDVDQPITEHTSRDANTPITSQNALHDTKKPMTSQHAPRDANKPIESQNPSHGTNKPMSQNPSCDENKPITSHNQSHDANKPITMHGLVKPPVAKKPLKSTRSLNPPPKPKRTFTTESTSGSNKEDFKKNLNAYIDDFSTKTGNSNKDTFTSLNGKSVQTSDQKQSSVEVKVTSDRKKPPKPLPRGKSQS